MGLIPAHGCPWGWPYLRRLDVATTPMPALTDTRPAIAARRFMPWPLDVALVPVAGGFGVGPAVFSPPTVERLGDGLTTGSVEVTGATGVFVGVFGTTAELVGVLGPAVGVLVGMFAPTVGVLVGAGVFVLVGVFVGVSAESVPVGVGVFVGVFVAVWITCVWVTLVKVGVGVFVGVFVEVLVGVLVEVFVAVFVGIVPVPLQTWLRLNLSGPVGPTTVALPLRRVSAVGVHTYA